MNRRPLIATVLAGLAVTLLAAPALRAQINITAPIHAARRAVVATNAHTTAEQKPTLGSTDVARDTTHGGNAPRAAAHPASRVPHPAPRAAGPEYHAADPVLTRESFTYTADGRRDPFVSLMTSGELRPMISDLKLVAIIYDPAGHSVAILRDLTTQEQYRVTVGKTLGRMRVAAIKPKSVTFTLEEFGYSRQEVLALNDSTTERAQ